MRLQRSIWRRLRFGNVDRYFWSNLRVVRAPGGMVRPHEPEFATTLRFIALLSIAATVLSLMIAAALSLIIMTILSVAG